MPGSVSTAVKLKADKGASKVNKSTAKAKSSGVINSVLPGNKSPVGPTVLLFWVAPENASCAIKTLPVFANSRSGSLPGPPFWALPVGLAASPEL